MTKRRAARTADDPALAEDRRLAALHLRLGQLSLARAELEDLHRRGTLDDASLADLAEARWRAGDDEGASVAAAEHLAAGGLRPIALVIAAESAAAAGRPEAARTHVESVGAIEAADLEALFAGMPRHAVWPVGPGASIVTPSVPTDAAEGAHLARSARAPAMAGLWGDDEAGLDGRAGDADGPGAAPDHAPVAELDRARAELGSGDPADAARGVARLALLLRLDPALGAAVIHALGTRRDVESLLVLGDANRLLGRHLEAEAAFAAAGRLLDATDRRDRA